MSEAILTPVREAHRFDEAALQSYLECHQHGFRGPLTIRQFEGGQSNPTYLVEAASGRYVLRKQPPGELLPSAHQVDREYRVMDALVNSSVPVPKMRCLCMDRDVIGAAFYVMDYVEGRMFSDATLPGATTTERRAMYSDLARVLAELHRIDPQAVGLGDFGRPGNYFARQISRWSRQYEASATEHVEAMTRLMRWLPENIPDSERTSIVHGDYRVGNCLMAPEEPRIAAVLDWELSTLGDPLADLGYVCQTYYIKAVNIGVGGADLERLGIPEQKAFVMEYRRYGGSANVDDLQFSIIYNLFRLAGISQGVYKRGLDGNASSEQALTFKDLARKYADIAWHLVVSLA